MKRLCELLDISVNNEACVLFKVKESARMDLISLGCFRGNEEMIRMTKGRTPEITVFCKDGSIASYHFGEGSTSVLTANTAQQREMIRECAILDFGIVCDWSHMPSDIDYDFLVQDSMDIRSLQDAGRMVTLVSGGGMSGNIWINYQGMALRVDVKDVPAWFEQRGYHVTFERDISQGLPCGKVYGECTPLKEYQLSQMPHELAENRVVQYVQEKLLCDKEAAAEFLKGLEKAHLIEDARRLVAYYGKELTEMGLRSTGLSDDDLAKIGERVDRAERIILADNGEAAFDAMASWIEKNKSKSKSLNEVLSDVTQRAGGIKSKPAVEVEKEL